MFLDDKLQEIYDENKDRKIVEVCQALIDECVSRIPNPDTMSVGDWLNNLRRIDSSWQLFCKKNPIFNKHGFRDVMMGRVGDDSPEYNEIFKALRWKE